MKLQLTCVVVGKSQIYDPEYGREDYYVDLYIPQWGSSNRIEVEAEEFERLSLRDRFEGEFLPVAEEEKTE